MVAIRLKRMGSKAKPYYRIVVTDSRKNRDGRSSSLAEVPSWRATACSSLRNAWISCSIPQDCPQIRVRAMAKPLRRGVSGCSG